MSNFETLYQELKRAKVPLPNFNPDDQFFAEADYALKPHSHECKIITYGFIRVENLTKLDKYVIVSPNNLTIAQARSIADGTNLFVVIED